MKKTEIISLAKANIYFNNLETILITLFKNNLIVPYKIFFAKALFSHLFGCFGQKCSSPVGY